MSVIPVAAHTVYLCNRSTSFDWFERDDHENMLDGIRCRTDLSEAEKQAIIANAYLAVSADEGVLPDWVTKLSIKSIVWDDNTSIEQTTSDVESYFGLKKT